MAPNEGLKEDRRGGSAPIVLELEPNETFVYRSTAMLGTSDLRSVGSSLLHDGGTAFDGEFRADPAVLAREAQTVSRAEGSGERDKAWPLLASMTSGLGSDRLESVKVACANRQGREGPQPQTLELVIGRFKPGRRVGTRAWPTPPPKAPSQAPATPSGANNRLPVEMRPASWGLHRHSGPSRTERRPGG